MGRMIIRWVLLVLTAGGSVTTAQTYPSDGFIVWQSSRSGALRIWKMDPDGQNKTQLTNENSICPTVSPDGKWVAFKLGTNYNTKSVGIIRPDGTGFRWVETAVDVFTDVPPLPFVPAYPEGKGFYYGKNNIIYFFDPDTDTRAEVVRMSAFSSMNGANIALGGISKDRRYIVGVSDRYSGGYTGTNGTYDKSWCNIMLDMNDKSKVYMIGGGCEATIAPSGHTAYYVRGDNWPDTDIYKQDLDNVASNGGTAVAAYPNASWGHEYTPRPSTDGQWVLWAASTGDHDHFTADYNVFMKRAGVDERIRMTSSSANDAWPMLWVGSTGPVITAPTATGNPASNIKTTSAQLNATITATGGEDPSTVHAYWGMSDGQGDPAQWDHSQTDLGSQGAGDIYHDVSGLTAGTKYYFCFWVQNSAGGVRTTTLNFTTASEASAGPVGWWKLDGSGSVAADASGNGMDGTVTGAVTAAGHDGAARDFDGVDDCVTIPDNALFDVTTGLTLCGWVYLRTDPSLNRARIITKDIDACASPWLAYHLGGGYSEKTLAFEMGFADNANSGIATGTLELNTWYHITGTFDGSTIKLYQNGSLIGSRTTYYDDSPIGSPLLTNDGPLVIGKARQDCGSTGLKSGLLDGLVDDVRIYNRALSPTEVLDIVSVTAIGPDRIEAIPVVYGAGNIYTLQGNRTRRTVNGIVIAHDPTTGAIMKKIIVSGRTVTGTIR